MALLAASTILCLSIGDTARNFIAAVDVVVVAAAVAFAWLLLLLLLTRLLLLLTTLLLLKVLTVVNGVSAVEFNGVVDVVVVVASFTTVDIAESAATDAVVLSVVNGVFSLIATGDVVIVAAAFGVVDVKRAALRLLLLMFLLLKLLPLLVQLLLLLLD